MSASAPAHTEPNRLEQYLAELDAGQKRLGVTSIERRVEILAQCRDHIAEVRHDWVTAACEAKGIPAGSRMRMEEVLAGPATAMRQLQLFLHTMREIARNGRPKLPGRVTHRPDGRLAVPVTPCRGFFDSVAFTGFKATARLLPHVTPDNFDEHLAPAYRNLSDSGTSLVLGAGNVAGIPIADVLTKICVDNRAVLLKMNPVNEYLGPIFERAFAPLIQNDLLRIVYGDASVAATAIGDDRIRDIHITGSDITYNAIVWGPKGPERDRRRQNDEPLLQKPITSELGNMSPWIVVPGAYSNGQLQAQAESIVTSLTNNAAFNCIATRVILTWKQWPEREKFLDRIEQQLSLVPQRRAYYPGAEQRYEEFSGIEPDKARGLVDNHLATSTADTREKRDDGSTVFLAGRDGTDETLPWTLIRNVMPEHSASLCSHESFVCVSADIAIDADSPDDFLKKAVTFSNEKLWGTLAATLTVPNSFRRQSGALLEDSIDRLRYGVVAINQWSGLVFALLSPPWGGYPGSTPQDIQSGTGWVHNSLMLDGIEKTVLQAPLTVQPKPIWMPSHGDPEPVAWALFDLMRNPSIGTVANLSIKAIKGTLARST
jgi:acyl-CoA reductase-like NAD-dependent aldehyde dehydrogenase